MGHDEPTPRSLQALGDTTHDTQDTQHVEPPVGLAVPRLPLAAGARVGRFVVVELAAEGGMGALYKAYDPQLDRAVALKLVGVHGPGADHFRDRLVREARALARLSHPNVVTVYESGVFGDEVFVAMEFIEGTTIRRWLDTTPRRTRKEILREFIAAGEGLAAAHRAGLVHRDFKPDNVIVGADGRVRVVDFGLAHGYLGSASAKLVDPRDRDPSSTGDATVNAPLTAPAASEISSDPLSTPLTEIGARPGTPRYMAPEQHLGLPTTDKSDQFSFCVALYGALYRAHPFAPKGGAELAAAVTAGKVEPPPPDASVPRWLRAVLLRGMSPVPADRYPSMDALLGALRADPSIARRRWLAGGAVVALVLGAGASAAYLSNRPRAACEAAGRQVDVAWGPSRREAIGRAFRGSGVSYAEDARAAVERALDAYAREWSDTSTRACLARVERRASPTASEATSRCLADRLVEVSVLTEQLAVADAKSVAGAQAVALGLPSPLACENAARMGSVAPPPRDPATRARVDRLERQRAEAATRAELGHLEASREGLEKTLPEAEATGHGPLIADVLFDLGRVYSYSLDYARAQSALLRCVDLSDAARQDSTRAEAWVELVRLAYAQGHYEEAMVDADRAMGVVERVGDDELTASLLLQRAWARLFAGKAQDAAADGRRGLQLAVRASGEKSSLAAEMHSLLGSVDVDLEHLDDAEREGRQALAIVSGLYAEESERTARMAENLSIVLSAEEKYEEARALQERAVRIAVALWGERDPNTAIKRQSLGAVLVDLKRPVEAIAALEAARSALEADPDERESQWMAYTLTALGSAYLMNHDPARARPVLERAVALATDRQLDPDVAGESRLRLAQALADTGGDPKRATRLGRDALAELRKAPKLHVLADEAEAWVAARGK